jgi:predicted outer membrane lipoprotein
MAFAGSIEEAQWLEHPEPTHHARVTDRCLLACLRGIAGALLQIHHEDNRVESIAFSTAGNLLPQS